MITRLLPVVLGLVGFGASLCAQTQGNGDLLSADQLRLTGEVSTAPALTLYRPDLFSSVDGALLIHDLPVLTLLDGRRLQIAGDLSPHRLDPIHTIPVAFLSAVRVDPTASPFYGSGGPGGVVNLELNRTYTGGEVGAFYGASGGKYGREDFQSYIRGGVGTQNVQISGGASYSRSSGTAPTRSYSY